MWIIILKIILAIISIFTGGAIFYKYIKDNKLAVFLAGSVSILSAVYLFIEVKKDIKKLNAPTIESQSSLESEASAPNDARLKPSVPIVKLESEASTPNNKRRQSLPITTSNSKWITPSDNICRSNGGKVYDDGCRATWKEANKICGVSGGRLPTIDELKKVVTDCGGKIDEYAKNEDNLEYQSCYKSKGFVSYYYWSSSTVIGGWSRAWTFHFRYTEDYWLNEDGSNYVRCVRAG